MKFSILAATVVNAVMARSAVASWDNPDVGSGGDLFSKTIQTVTKDFIPQPFKDTVKQLNPLSGGYFAPFDTQAPSEKLFLRNGSLATLAPIINVAKKALNEPVPTNKWWGNLIHETSTNKSENYPAWAQPYSIKLPKVAPFGVQVCYPYTYRKIAPEVNGTVRWYEHGIHNDLTLSAMEFAKSKPSYEIYSWDDMGVKLRTCATGSSRCMDSALLSGMAFVSAKYDGLTPRIDTEHSILSVDNSTSGKFVIHLNNNQTWVLYADDKSISFHVTKLAKVSSNETISSNGTIPANGTISANRTTPSNETISSLVANAGYSGTLRIAILPEGMVDNVYDTFASCIVRGGIVSMESRTGYSINWDVEGTSCKTAGLLHFALPHQVESMTEYPTAANSPGAIKLHSTTRGLMVGQVSTTWKFHEPEADFKIDFYPVRKPTPWIVKQTKLYETLQDDISANWTMATNSWYFNGKLFQKYASLCLMAADSSVVGSNKTLLPYCLNKLETLIEPLLNNTLSPPLVIDTLYRGLISGQVFVASNCFVDFGNGCYNDHHYHYGYYVTAAAMLKFLDPNWSRMPELENLIWLMLRDVANPSRDDPHFPRFRHFSWYHGHSYSRGVTLSEQGKDEESTSEDVNFYFGMTMWGKVTGHKAIEDLGSLMLRLNAHSIRTYFLLLRNSVVHPPQIVRNHVTGIFFDNRVYYNTWFLDEVYAIHGIQMIPVSPVNELARTSTFVAQEWNDILKKQPIFTTKNSNNSWLSLLLVNGATVNPMDSMRKLQNATMDDGLTRSWALYNAATRCRKGVKTVDEKPLIEIVIELFL